MTHARSTFVVLPAYNEGRVLRSTLQPLLAAGYSIVVVDDGGTDGTLSLLADLPIHILRHSLNLGQGAALQTGMTYALGQGAEYIVHFDADGQHRVEDIAALLQPLRAGTADIVLGSRFLRRADRMAVPWARRCVLRVGTVVNGLLTGLWLSDAHNGLRALTRPAAEKIQLHENRYAHATEILAQIRSHGLRWVERPTTIHYTAYARAKGQPVHNAFNIVADVLIGKVFS